MMRYAKAVQRCRWRQLPELIIGKPGTDGRSPGRQTEIVDVSVRSRESDKDKCASGHALPVQPQATVSSRRRQSHPIERHTDRDSRPPGRHEARFACLISQGRWGRCGVIETWPARRLVQVGRDSRVARRPARELEGGPVRDSARAGRSEWRASESGSTRRDHAQAGSASDWKQGRRRAFEV
jgi:hypothetical protein